MWATCAGQEGEQVVGWQEGLASVTQKQPLSSGKVPALCDAVDGVGVILVQSLFAKLMFYFELSEGFCLALDRVLFL